MPDTEHSPPFEAYSGTAPYLFISYSHTDSARVFAEIARWHSLGYRIWYDEGIDPGNEWPDEVARALRGCCFFAVFVSPRSVASRNVRNEINLALDDQKPFLAIHLEETDLPAGLRLRMGDLQAVLAWRMRPANLERKINKVLPSAARSAAPTGATPSSTRRPASALRWLGVGGAAAAAIVAAGSILTCCPTKPTVAPEALARPGASTAAIASNDVRAARTTVWSGIVQDPTDRKVFEALSNPKFKAGLRTVVGLAREAALSEAEVIAILNRYPDLVAKTKNSAGDEVYGLHQ